MTGMSEKDVKLDGDKQIAAFILDEAVKWMYKVEKVSNTTLIFSIAAVAMAATTLVIAIIGG